MPKVSVVIPVFGVEKYIERCARSLFEQTLDDIEYLFIDDCSLDNSIEILKKVLDDYPHRKTQVIIHKMVCNSGQAKVREWGTKNASGEYIIHCDSDDWVEFDMYEKMYKKAIDESSDIVICDYYKEKKDYSNIVKVSVPSSSDKCIRNLFSGAFPSYMWNKMIKMDLYQFIEWPQGNMWEDMAVMTQLLQKTPRIAYLSNAYYHYFVRNDSIVGRVDKESVLKKWNDVRCNVELILNHIDKNDFSDDIVTLKKRARTNLDSALYDKEVWQIYISAYPGLDKDILLSSRYTFRDKVKSILYRSIIFHELAFSLFSVNAKHI